MNSNNKVDRISSKVAHTNGHGQLKIAHIFHQAGQKWISVLPSGVQRRFPTQDKKQPLRDVLLAKRKLKAAALAQAGI